MPSAFLLLLASATNMVGVSAYVPPNCGYSLAGGSVDAWCNASRWSVVARRRDGTEVTVWQATGVGKVTLPATLDAGYRVDFDY